MGLASHLPAAPAVSHPTSALPAPLAYRVLVALFDAKFI